VSLRVLHVVGCYPPATEWGGASSAAAAMVEAVAGAGVEAEVFTTTQRGTRAHPRTPAGPGRHGSAAVTWFRSIHALGRGFVAPSMAPALWRRVGEFDVVHLHMMWTFPTIVAAWACRARGVPYVVSTHGALDPWALTQRALEKRLFLALAERENLRAAAAIHFTAEGERRTTPAWVQALPGVVVPNPVEAEPFLGLGLPTARAASREVLILGRVHPVKGFDVLLPAWRAVVAEEPAARLVVAGPDEGGYLARVRALAAELGVEGSVRFTGLLDAAGRAAALARAAVLVAPSYQENFGMAVAEAMAAGLPVVISDRVKIADEVASSGGGLVVPPEPRPLGDALLALLRDPGRRAAMGAAGRRLAVESFAPAAVGRGLRAAYEAALDRRRRGRPAREGERT
jgi:glycosyltransferase involved in cell wall biosynthesis